MTYDASGAAFYPPAMPKDIREAFRDLKKKHGLERSNRKFYDGK